MSRCIGELNVKFGLFPKLKIKYVLKKLSKERTDFFYQEKQATAYPGDPLFIKVGNGKYFFDIVYHNYGEDVIEENLIKKSSRLEEEARFLISVMNA